MKIQSLLISISAIAIITACGSGSNYSDKNPKADNIGVYEDAPISGIEYKCGKYSGVTNSAGEFKYEFNKSCKFSFFGKTIDEFSADTTAYKNIHLQIKNQEACLGLAALDSDGNLDNGFDINYNVGKKYFKKGMSESEFEEATKGYVKEMGFKPKEPSQIEKELKAHQEKRLKELLGGKTLWLGVKLCGGCGYDEKDSSKAVDEIKFLKITFNKELTIAKREWIDTEGETYEDAITLDGNIINYATISLRVVATSNKAIKAQRLDDESEHYEWYFYSKADCEAKLKENN